jgi:hypothetical protein
VEHRELKVEYRRFESSGSEIAQLPPLRRVLQISEIDDEAAAAWWLIEPALIRDAKRCMGEDGPIDWLGVNYAEWNPTFSNRGSFRYAGYVYLSSDAYPWFRVMMERRLSFLSKDVTH